MEDGGVVKKERRMKDIEEKKIKKITLTKNTNHKQTYNRAYKITTLRNTQHQLTKRFLIIL